MTGLKNLFKKTVDKADTAINNVADDATKLIANANELVDNGKDKAKIVVYIVLAGFALNVVSNIATIVCCGRVNRSVNRNDVLNEVAKMLRNKG